MPSNPRRLDVLIVGAGVIGLAAAYHIKRLNKDLSVLVVDRLGAAAQGDTAKSLAAMRDMFTSDVNRLLAGSSIAFYRHVQSELGFNLNLELIGYLWLFNKKEFEAFEPMEAHFRRNSVRFRIFEPDNLHELIPDLTLNPASEQSKLMGLEPIYKAIQGLDCGVVGPELVASFYEAECRKLGVEFLFRTEVKALRLGAKHPLGFPREPHVWQESVFTGAVTNTGVVNADTIVVAAGSRTPFLMDPVGIDCLVKPKKRQVFQVRGSSLDRLLNTEGFNEEGTIPLTILPKAGVHFRPARKERSTWVACADHLGRAFGFEEEPSDEGDYYTYGLYPVLSEYFPCFSNLRPMNSWAGLYDINSLDHNPVIERFQNLIVVVGLSGSGIMKADAVGRVAAALFNGNDETELFGNRKIETSRLGIGHRRVEKERLVL